jgi:peptidoglycan hydrolase CwlO-like protein
LDNFAVIGLLGVLALYFYSSMNIYKSIYRRTLEEKSIAEENVKALEKIIKRYENQIQSSIATIGDSQDSLQVAREDLQKIKVINNELEHRNQLLQERVDELYASVGSI